MRRVALLFLPLVIAVLAGCAGDDGEGPSDAPTSAECLEQGLILGQDAQGEPACVEPPFAIREFEDPNHDCVTTRQRDRVHAPDLVGNPWVLGQWWEYNLNLDGRDLGTTKLVYYADQDFAGEVAQHYMVGTVTREEALRHALFSENPMVGRVHRILYSPHETGDHADMFHFPLCEGSSWTTMFYGETFTLTASTSDLDLPGGGSDEGFLIEGTSSGGSTLRLSYSPETQWFTFIDLDRADGQTVDMRLDGMGSGYAGEAFFLRGQGDESFTITGEDGAGAASVGLPIEQEATFTRDDGTEGPYDTIGVAIDQAITGALMAWEFEILDPSGGVALQSMGLDPSSNMSGLYEFPYAAGEWTVRLSGVVADPEMAAQLSVQVRVVSIYDRSGSV